MRFDPRLITIGSTIYSKDGDQLGTVKEVRDGYIHVDARLQPDYWLPLGSVDAYAQDRVTMVFDKDQLGEHKANEPADETNPLPVRDIDLASRTGVETQSELTRPDDRELPPSS